VGTGECFSRIHAAFCSKLVPFRVIFQSCQSCVSSCGLPWMVLYTCAREQRRCLATSGIVRISPFARVLVFAVVIVLHLSIRPPTLEIQVPPVWRVSLFSTFYVSPFQPTPYT